MKPIEHNASSLMSAAIKEREFTLSGLNFSLYLDRLCDNPKLIGAKSCAPRPDMSSVN